MKLVEPEIIEIPAEPKTVVDLETEAPAKSKVLKSKKITPSKRAESLPKAAAPVKKQRLDRGSKSIVRAEKVQAKPKTEE